MKLLMGGAGRAESASRTGRDVGVRAEPAIVRRVGQVGQVGRVGVRAAPAIVGRVGQVGQVGRVGVRAAPAEM